MNARERLLLAAILLLAALARFTALDHIPYGIYPDEAIYANEGVYAIAHGEPKLFYPENGGREGLFINLAGLLNGNVRALSAASGTLAVLLIFLLARHWFSTRAALVAAFLLATSFWHLNFSRIGFRGTLVPTLLLAAIYGYERGTKWSTALGGIALGLGFHSYIAFRAVPLLIAGMLLLPRKRWILWLGIAALVAAPMAVYFALHPEDFSRRIEELSGSASIWDNLFRTAKMFHVSGDCNPRHNLPCQPELNLPTGILFLIGIGAAALAYFKASYRPAAIILMWLPIMLLPAALSNEGVPHALRSIGAIPAVILLATFGAAWSLEKLRHPAATWALIAILAGFGAHDLYRYFGVWANSPAVHDAFNANIADLAAYLNALPPETPRYVIANEAAATAPADPGQPDRRYALDLQSLIFLVRGHPQPNYLRVQEFFTADFPPGSVVAPLLGDTRVLDALRNRGIEFEEQRNGAAIAARIR